MPVPRYLTSALIEELSDSVVVTFGLGEVVPPGSAEYFGYEIYYYAPDGNGGKRFGVRLSETQTSAHVWDNNSTTQANYTSDHVKVTDDAIVVTYRDASLGLEEVGTLAAFSHVAGVDLQREFPVTLLR